MRKYVSIFMLVAMLVATVSPAIAQSQQQYNFGDYKSMTLASKAWMALAENKLEAVEAYVNKCVELYDAKAKEMQAGLTEYPSGDDQKIFSYWALNDIATGYFILGTAYLKNGKNDKAKEVFEKLVKNYSFGQCYDPGQKLFWKPAEAAQEKLDQLAKGIDLDFSDCSSSALTTKAWQALSIKNIDMVTGYADKVIKLYANKAKEMQGSLKEYAWESKEKIFSYWALNDVGTCYFILGEVYRLNNRKTEALEAYKKLVNEYSFAQCWDPQGWFWKPAEAAQQKIIELESMGGSEAAPAAASTFNK